MGDETTTIVLVDQGDKNFSFTYKSRVIPHTNDLVYINELDKQFRVERMVASTNNGIILVGCLLSRTQFYSDHIEKFFKHNN